MMLDEFLAGADNQGTALRRPSAVVLLTADDLNRGGTAAERSH